MRPVGVGLAGKGVVRRAGAPANLDSSLNEKDMEPGAAVVLLSALVGLGL